MAVVMQWSPLFNSVCMVSLKRTLKMFLEVFEKILDMCISQKILLKGNKKKTNVRFAFVQCLLTIAQNLLRFPRISPTNSIRPRLISYCWCLLFFDKRLFLYYIYSI